MNKIVKQEGLVKSISEGRKTLEHTRYRNPIGMLVDSFNLIITSENGLKTHYPMWPPPKANNYDKNSDISEMVNDYTDEEMLEVLRNNP